MRKHKEKTFSYENYDELTWRIGDFVDETLGRQLGDGENEDLVMAVAEGNYFAIGDWVFHWEVQEEDEEKGKCTIWAEPDRRK